MTGNSRFLLPLSLLAFALACNDAPEGDMDSGAAATADAPKPVELSDSQSGAMVLAPTQLAARLEEGTAPVLLDVRSAEEFAAGHIPGAINVPYDEVPARLAEIVEHRDAELVVYCRTGRRAKIAEAALREAGFRQVADLDGHMTEWTAAGYPVTDPQPCC
ncbi:MAG: rhodanese-like domain-containing protein [marine benthic group bacterium]|nr:rhodanese-like domain-containing protein [Gemmatimonadota bacterium]